MGNRKKSKTPAGRKTGAQLFDPGLLWSPNGQVLAFASDRDGDWDIFALATDGLVQLTDDPADDQTPVWSADSKQLVFASDRNGNWDIYLMNADGSEQTNLTNNRADDVNPAWAP